jgi:hypothetical protein
LIPIDLDIGLGSRSSAAAVSNTGALQACG